MKLKNIALSVCALSFVIFLSQTAGAQAIRCPGPRTVRVTKPKLAPQALAPASFGISLDIDANVPADFQAVIHQAANEWNSVLLSAGVNPPSYKVSVTLGQPVNANALAETTIHVDDDGSLDHADIVIRPNLLVFNSIWYVDPSPADDSEFAQDPPAGHDLLSVIRHELGHAVGWTGATGYERVAKLVANGVFDAARLNIAVVDDASHADPAAHPGELMAPASQPSTRRPIRLYPTAALVARAYEYEISMRFVDPNFVGQSSGNASSPYKTVGSADIHTEAGIPILLAPVTHPAVAGTTLSVSRDWITARGGAIVVGQ